MQPGISTIRLCPSGVGMRLKAICAVLCSFLEEERREYLKERKNNGKWG